MIVKLTYFKPSGKYYSNGEYETTKEHMFDIFDEVNDLLTNKKLPGLVEGHSLFNVLIDVPRHPNNHPHLVLCI